MQSIVVTRLDDYTAVNVAYRSVEVFKKLAADLVFLRDELLTPFGTPLRVTCNIANATVHPLYFATIIPHLNDPVGEMEKIRQRDERFYRHIVRQSADLLCGGKTNANFMQAQRVKRHVVGMIDPDASREVRGYLRRASERL